MDLLKKPSHHSFHALLWILLLSCLLAHPFSEATSSPPGENRDYILILNTYTESTPWSREINNSISVHIEVMDNIDLYTEHMNSLLMKTGKQKFRDIEEFKRNVQQAYGANPPKALILLGAPIAVMRDFVNTLWPDIPIIFCSEMDYIGPTEAYLNLRPITSEERTPLAEIVRGGRTSHSFKPRSTCARTLN